jgi:probable F420-dependent oxidoreductase
LEIVEVNYVKVGVYTFATDRDMRPDMFAREVEDRGFAALMLPEHAHIPTARQTPYPGVYGGGVLPGFYQRTYDPFVALSFMAAATTTLRIGTGICLLALRDPIHTAKEIASLDLLSGGRFNFGVGFGWNADEFVNHRVDFGTRHALVREKVELMRRLWLCDVADYEGSLVSLTPSWSWPKPVQSPHPPIYLGGNGPLTMRHAAQWADVWYPTGPADDPDLERAVPAFRRMVAEAGRDPDHVRVGLAPAAADAARLERLAANGVDECNVAVMGTDEAELLRNLDALAVARKQVFGS